MPPLLSVLPFDCIRKCLIEGPQDSSVRSFVPLHDPTRRPRCSSSSAPVLCSLHFSLRGTPLASSSHRVLLCWILRREDQTTPLCSLLRPRLRSDATAPLSPQQCTGTPPIQSCHRATTTCLSFTRSPALSQTLLEGLSTLPRPPRRSPSYDTA
jgi:hypothetical protein